MTDDDGQALARDLGAALDRGIIANYKGKWLAERALADDLADVLADHFGMCDVPEMERVLARYREARR